MFGELLARVRESTPLVHCITNIVTVNDCANVLLACGASPIMAEAPEEAAAITARSDGLVLNLGTLRAEKIPAMLASGREANGRNIPVVLDPVGVGASPWRMEAALRLLREIRFTVIRGNAAEIRALAGAFTPAAGDAPQEKGVDAGDVPRGVSPAAARTLAARTGAAVALTGETDLVADGDTLYRLHNGHPLMRRVTGAGCQLSALTGAFVAANRTSPAAAAAAAVCALGLCGERAAARMGPQDGNASYRNYLIDAVFRLTPEDLEKGARYEVC